MPTKHDSLLNIPTAKLNGELGQPQIKKSKTLLLKPPGQGDEEGSGSDKSNCSNRSGRSNRSRKASQSPRGRTKYDYDYHI